MKILANKLEDGVVCVLPDGYRVEITMVSVEGEDVYDIPDIHEAMKLLHRHLSAISPSG